MNKKQTLFGLLLLASVALGACSSPKEATKKQAAANTEQVSESSSEVEESHYRVGDTIVFEGHAEYTITSVEWTEERNQFEADFLETVPDKVLKVTYTVKNLSDEEYSIGSDLELYVAGKKMEVYPNTNTLDTVSAGRSYEGAIKHFGVIGEGALELEIKPFLSFDSKPAVVVIDAP